MKEKRMNMAIGENAYKLLDEICKKEYRSIINQLTLLIEKEHKRLFPEAEDEH